MLSETLCDLVPKSLAYLDEDVVEGDQRSHIAELRLSRGEVVWHSTRRGSDRLTRQLNVAAN